ncbi:tetraspanin-33-like [Scyliorhinus canicula]|uniref:tetraspanin-33-like n=1 Tax=Scyliorhinus canicula TaxID=7830 RepID=UPI0018F2C37B|nr:tetraspanin-33-like [Scyliorhinus canicula]
MDIGGRLSRGVNITFINPWIKYYLFFFSFLFWIISLVIVAIGVYAKIQKATDAVRDTFVIDPAIIMIVVGAVMFLITFCGCIGALRENIVLLQVVSLLKPNCIHKTSVHYCAHFKRSTKCIVLTTFLGS